MAARRLLLVALQLPLAAGQAGEQLGQSLLGQEGVFTCQPVRERISGTVCGEFVNVESTGARGERPYSWWTARAGWRAQDYMCEDMVVVVTALIARGSNAGSSMVRAKAGPP